MSCTLIRTWRAGVYDYAGRCAFLQGVSQMVCGGISCTCSHIKGARSCHVSRWRGWICTGTQIWRGGYRDNSWSCKEGRLWAGQGFQDCHGCRIIWVEEWKGQGLLQAAKGRHRVHLRGAYRALGKALWQISYYINRGWSWWGGLGRLAEAYCASGR